MPLAAPFDQTQHREGVTVKCVVVGAGRLGRSVETALRDRGVDTIVVSRATGVDVTAPRLDPKPFEGADAVVEATDIATQKADLAAEFFTSSTRSINAAAREAAVGRHLLVSIVNCEHPRLAGNGYYAAKAAQERVAAEENENMTVIRSTLWFEFARQNLERMTKAFVSIVPQMTIRPVALESVAEVVADCVVGERAGARFDVCGPSVMSLWQMTRALPDKRCVPLSVPVPGTAGRALRDGALIPAPGCELIGPDFTTWLRQGLR
jgi:uncharacterized protein YbjT (DUF2867 family)